MKYTFIFLYALLSSYCNAQQVEWAIKANYSFEDAVSSTSTDQNGNVYVSGTSVPYNSSPYSGLGTISKYSPLGVLIWTDTIPRIVRIRSVTDSLGNTYATGYFSLHASFGNFTLYGTSSIGGFLVKYDSMGNCLWAKNIFGCAIVLNPKGGFYTTATDFGLFSKFDDSGNVIWSKQVAIRGQFGRCSGASISVDLDGNAYVAGQFKDSVILGAGTNTKSIYYNGPNENYYIAKYDTSGVFRWVATPLNPSYGFWPYDLPSISVDNFGNSYLTGFFNDSLAIGDSTFISTHLKYSSFIIKCNTNGALLFAQVISGTGDNQCYSIINDKQNNIYISGAFTGVTNFGNNVISTSVGGGLNSFAAKFTDNGTSLWIRHAEDGSSLGYAICKDNNNNVYMGGRKDGITIFGNDTLSGSGPDMFLVKISESTITTDDKEKDCDLKLLIYPNPTQGYFQTEFTSFKKGVLQINITDVNGKVVYSDSVYKIRDEFQISIDLSTQVKGIYFIEMVAGNERVVRRVSVQ